MGAQDLPPRLHEPAVVIVRVAAHVDHVTRRDPQVGARLGTQGRGGGDALAGAGIAHVRRDEEPEAAVARSGVGVEVQVGAPAASARWPARMR